MCRGNKNSAAANILTLTFTFGHPACDGEAAGRVESICHVRVQGLAEPVPLYSRLHADGVSRALGKRAPDKVDAWGQAYTEREIVGDGHAVMQYPPDRAAEPAQPVALMELLLRAASCRARIEARCDTFDATVRLVGDGLVGDLVHGDLVDAGQGGADGAGQGEQLAAGRGDAGVAAAGIGAATAGLPASCVAGGRVLAAGRPGRAARWGRDVLPRGIGQRRRVVRWRRRRR